MSLRLVIVLLLASSVAVSAQTPAPVPAKGNTAVKEASAAQAPVPNTPTAAEPSVEPAGFTYRPEGRRDPFVSLLQRGTDSERSAVAVRAPGLAGLGASEVTLKGTLASQGGYVAIMQGADTKTYIVRPGERLMDGTVRAITPDTVVILQQVKDPLAADKEREVRKTLRQNEEAK